MRADRLISLLMLLQSRNGLTARQLAEELEVSERTIYRDMTALNIAGIPVYSQSGPGGGCFLLEEYRTTLTGMTPDQARALFALSVPAPLDQLGLSGDLKAALLKLSAALPDSSRREQGETRQRLYLDWGFDTPAGQDSTVLKTIAAAVWEDRLLRLRFRSLSARWINSFDQVIAPYSLVAWAAEWYLVCFWEGLGHVLRLSLVEEVEVLPDTFTRPPDFDLAGYWLDWRRRYETDRPRYDVLLRASPAIAPHLKDFQPGGTDETGWITGTLTCEYFESALRRILSYGGAVEVLEPPALRCSVIDYARQVLSRYPPEGG